MDVTVTGICAVTVRPLWSATVAVRVACPFPAPRTIVPFSTTATFVLLLVMVTSAVVFVVGSFENDKVRLSPCFRVSDVCENTS